MRWGRFGAFIATVLVILSLTLGTSLNLWKSIQLGLDLKGGFDLLYKIHTGGPAPTAQQVAAEVQAVQLRVNTIGVTSPIIQVENKNWIRVELAGAFDQTAAKQIIGETPDLRIYGTAVVRKDGSFAPDPKSQPLMLGSDLKSNAAWSQDPNNGQNVVVVNFKDPAKWQAVTKAYLGKTLYTFLNGKLVTAATVQQVMSTGTAEIYGGNLNSPEACQTLAKELNAGALPFPLDLISSTQVGPTLGNASLHATMWAGLFAVLLIFLFMIVMYRLAGLIADLALVAYTYLVLVTFSGLHVVLTLPGLAALVLGIGIAVDANIITYERIKDEMRNGKSLQSSVLSGNKRALRTIIDSNATTFIAGAVMYWFGVGDIKGFAVALMISIIVSLLTAVLLSRMMLILFTRSNAVRSPWWFGIGKGVLPR